VSYPNDYELAVRLRQGDVEAFDILYQKYHQGLYFNILKLIRHTAATQDILQEVFLKLWERRSSLDPDQSVTAWLFVVSYNKAADYLKHYLRHSISLDESQEKIMALPPEESYLTIEERTQLLTEAIGQLSPQKRRVLELCKLQGKTYEETAQELHISRHTVKEYLATAISHIKGYIRQHGAMLWFL
jgi:RNA polymerase sigma-70 factor (family 1)